MWTKHRNSPALEFLTPPPKWNSKPSLSPNVWSDKKRLSPDVKNDLFHVIHKVPAGDSPYVRAKHVQLIERDPSRAISLFWAAINSGDRVDSALKDMAVVMKQLNRADEAIEAIKSFRHLCPIDSQESLDNVLVELYKRAGRIEEQIEMLQLKLKHIEDGIAFGGKKTKIARSQGKKVHMTVDQERSRLLGNLAWAYLQKNNYKTAEELYRKALSLEPDKNKECNLAICLMHMNRIREAKSLLQSIRRGSSQVGEMNISCAKSFERASQILTELEESQSVLNPAKLREEDNSKSSSFPCLIEFKTDCRDVCKEIKPSFTYPIDRNSEDLSHPINGGTYCQNQLDNKINYSGFDKNIYTSPVPVRENSKVSFTEPRRGSRLIRSADQRNRFCKSDAVCSVNRKISFDRINVDGDWREQNDAVMNKSIVDGQWKKNPCKIDGQEKLTTKASSNTSFNSTEFKDSQTQEFSLIKSGKSWADIVEEEEELMRRESDFQENILSEESFFSSKTWDSREEFANQNLNVNITHQAQFDNIETVNEKLECDSQDGHTKSGTVSESAFSSINPKVRRSLCFDKQKEGKADDYSDYISSSMPQKALEFEGCDELVMVKNRGSGLVKNIQSKWRNRLQVFKEITLLPESPRA